MVEIEIFSNRNMMGALSSLTLCYVHVNIFDLISPSVTFRIFRPPSVFILYFIITTINSKISIDFYIAIDFFIVIDIDVVVDNICLD